MSEKTLAELAEYVGGEVRGDGCVIIKAAATLEEAGEGDITFLANQKYEKLLKTTKAGAIIAGKDCDIDNVPLLIAEDPYYAFTQIIILLYGHRKHKKVGVSKQSDISTTASVGKDCDIHDFVTIDDDVVIGDNCIIYPGVFVGRGTTIGNNCILYPNVTIYDNSVIGDRVIINANAIIGEDGFGFATHNTIHHKIPQVGRAIIEDDVEIGAGCGIERGTLADTIIGKGSKLGDLVAIGHGARVGPHSLLVAQVGIAGSAQLGHHCVVGGQVGIVGHIKIGDAVQIGAQAGVINDIEDGKVVFGAPAIEASQARRAYSMIKLLPDMRQQIRKLEKKLAKLEGADPSE